MGSAAMAQLNVRIDRDLKERGDRELALVGVSPSEMVRGVWEKLAQGGSEREDILEAALGEERSPERQAEIDRKLAALERGSRLFYEFAEKLGLDPSTHEPMTDEEWEEARYQHILEKYGA